MQQEFGLKEAAFEHWCLFPWSASLQSFSSTVASASEQELCFMPATMGTSESTPVTPTSKPLLNKHLAHVSDPRSPTAGILRTPIEVQSSPQGRLWVDSKEEGSVDNDENRNMDPRSPTPGILRTPMKTVVADTINNLVKQLSEAFTASAAEEEPSRQSQKHKGSSVLEEVTRKEAASGEAPQRGGESKEQLTENTSVLADTKPGVSPADVLCPAGCKPVRRRAGSKMLTLSTGSGRSPLSVLQDDNSPGSLASQSKPHPSLADNQGEYKEGALASRRTLKAGNCGRGVSLNKENRPCHLVEN